MGLGFDGCQDLLQQLDLFPQQAVLFALKMLLPPVVPLFSFWIEDAHDENP